MYWAKQRTQLKGTWPYFRQKNVNFSLLFSDVASKVHTQQKLCQRIRIFLFLSYSFGIETTNTSNAFLHSGNSLENHTRFQTKMSKVYIRKTIPFGVAHTNMAHTRISPGRKSKYLTNSVRGPECPLNASFGRETLWKGNNWFEGLTTKQCRDR